MLEDRLRRYYRDEVAGLEAADMLPGVLAAGRRARRRTRALWAGVLAAAAVALVVGLPALFGRAHARPAVHPPSSRPFTVLTRTDLAGWGPPSAMAAVPGGVWLASWDEGGLLRIDAATGRITARVPVGQPMQGPYSIAYGAGSLWVTDFRTGDLLRLNPATGRLIADIPLGAGARYVTVGGGFVWVTTFGPVSGLYWNRLVKIDPVTDRILGDVPVPGNYGPGGMRVAATGVAVWLHIDGAPFVQAADPARMRVTARARTGDAWRLVAIDGRVWVLTDGWTLDRIDPSWSAVSGSVQLPGPPSGPAANLGGDIAAGPDGTLWVGGQALYQVSQASMRVRTISGFGAVDDVSVLGNTLWVQADDGSVYQAALHRPGTSPAVPDVAMLPLAAAERLLTHDGYTVKVAREAGLEPLERVIFQDPAAGSLVPPGTRVTLVISAGPATGTGSP
jgi:PASTA domain